MGRLAEITIRRAVSGAQPPTFQVLPAGFPGSPAQPGYGRPSDPPEPWIELVASRTGWCTAGCWLAPSPDLESLGERGSTHLDRKRLAGNRGRRHVRGDRHRRSSL